MSTNSKSTTKSSAATSSDRNKNLLAAKSVLGLDHVANSNATATATVTDGHAEIDVEIESNFDNSFADSTTITTTMSPLSRARGKSNKISASNTSKTITSSSSQLQQDQHQQHQLLSSSLRTLATSTTATSASTVGSKTTSSSTIRSSGGAKHSFIHSLSDTARLEARRRSEEEIHGRSFVSRTSGGSEGRSLRSGSDEKIFNYVSRTSGGSEGRSLRSGDGVINTLMAPVDMASQVHNRSLASTRTLEESLTIPSTKTSFLRESNTISVDGSINDISTLEEGSEYDSLTAKPFATDITRDCVRNSLLHNNSSKSFSERTASSSRSGNMSKRSNASSNNDSNPSIGRFDQKRVREFPAQDIPKSHHGAQLAQSLANQSAFSSNASQSVTSRSLLSESSSDIFVPRRFEEVRSLLMAVTPLQLEGLLREIFDNSSANDSNLSFSSSFQRRNVLPRGWRGTAKKSKTRGFRKDAYLSELTIDEIKRYTADKNIHGMDECVTHQEAMDLIAFEFEHLVSGFGGMTPYESGSTTSSVIDDNGEITRHDKGNGENFLSNHKSQHGSSSNHDTMMQSSSSSLVKNQSTSTILERSTTGAAINFYDEMSNLRSTLRSCTLPELQFVAERMEIDFDATDDGMNKSDLILLIENSVQRMMSRSENDDNAGESSVFNSSLQSMDEGNSSSWRQQQKAEEGERQLAGDNNHRNVQRTEERHIDDDDNFIPRRNERKGMHDSQNRRVRFSHQNQLDSSNVISSNDRGAGTWDNNFSSDDYDDVEQGYDDDCYDNINEVIPFRDPTNRKARKKKKNARKGQGSLTPKYSNSEKARKALNKSPWKVFGFLLLVALVVGLSVGLTKKDASSEVNQEMSNPFISDPSDPFFQNQLQDVEKSSMPTALPTMIINETLGEVSSPIDDTLATLFSAPTPFPEIKYSVAPTSSTPTYAPLAMSRSPFTTLDESITTTNPSLFVSSKAPLGTTFPSTTVIADIATITTTTPTEPHPLLGPFNESGMRIILYGVSNLSENGSTQWEMLTAAFINQFFNNDGKGDDAVQNIVFDVETSVGIERTDELISGGGSRQRELQMVSASVGVIVTFTATLSYRSLSSGVDTKTILEHPFLDEKIRLDYYDWLIDNNAVAHIGNIVGISSVFYGEDIPDVVSLATLSPAQSSVLDLPEVNFPIAEQYPTQFPTTSIQTPSPTTSAIEAITREPTMTTNSVTSQPSISLGSTYYPSTMRPFATDATTSSPSPPGTELFTSESSLLPSMPSMDSTTSLPSISLRLTTEPSYSMKPSYEPSGGETVAYTYSPVGSPRSTAASIITTDPTYIDKLCMEFPTTDPICPFLAEYECCRPMCRWDFSNIRCSFVDDDKRNEVNWRGMAEIGQTHVVRAIDETRHAPKIIAHREAELLFTPDNDGVLDLGLHDRRFLAAKIGAQSLESYSKVYLVSEDDEFPILDASAQRLVDGSGTVFSLPNNISNISIIVDLISLRLVEEVSIVLHGGTTVKEARFGLHYDDGRSQDDSVSFRMPSGGWKWVDYSTQRITKSIMGKISISCSGVQARYVMIKLKAGGSATSHWGFGSVKINGRMDGLLAYQNTTFSSMSRRIDPEVTANTTPRTYSPPRSAHVLLAVYSPSGHLIGVKNVRDPSKQRKILDRFSFEQKVQRYSDSIWSVTLPYNWVDEGNVVLIGSVDARRPTELLIHRLELNNLAHFSEHTVTRSKLAVFGDSQQVEKLDPYTHEAKRLARNLFAVMPVAELKWVDTDLWHLPYLVVMGKDGPVLVNSEDERRLATGEGTEISWSILKNHLTIRHSLAQTGFGMSITSESGQNSPYASGTSVFMGWSLIKREDSDELEWEDLGYWGTLAAAAWTGWCALKAGDECSNYFVHEMGHAQSMEHFDHGTASKWGIEDEYPQDGKHMSHHPWGYDTVERKFRTLFDFRGDGKLDPLNGAGEDPTFEQCFSQYTPYQAQKSQDWASNTPLLLSVNSSSVPVDGAYKFNRSTRQYVPLRGSLLTDAVGENALQPEQVGVPVITLIGTIGKHNDVCQIYPPLRSRLGNTFRLPDPFSLDLPKAFFGSAHFIEVKFVDGTIVRGLIAVGKDLSEASLKFFSFNLGLHIVPMSVSLYRFTEKAYPEISRESEKELLYLRPIEFSSGSSNPLEGLPPVLKVGRGWVGGSPDVILDRFCISPDDCISDRYNVEWRADIGNDRLVYKSSLAPEAQNLLGATVFKVPATRQWDSATQYSITILITRANNDGVGFSPLLTRDPLLDVDVNDMMDDTHLLRVVAPWEMNASLPGGTYRSAPGVLKVSAETVGSIIGKRHVLDIDVSFSLTSINGQPTLFPSMMPLTASSISPVQVRWYIDWKLFTCVTDGESTIWAPAYSSKLECCQNHMGYDVNLCFGN